MVETKQLDEELKSVEPVKEIDPSELPELPRVSDIPEGWSSFCTMDGDTWYARAKMYEFHTGRRALPDKYKYNEDGIIVERSQEEIDAMKPKTVIEYGEAEWH